MKKHIAKAFGISLFLAATLTSCELLENCKTCYIVTYENGVEVSRGPGIVYCGDKLAEKENADPVSIGGNRQTDYECD